MNKDPELEDLLKLLEEAGDTPVSNLPHPQQFMVEKVKPHPKESVTTEIIYHFYTIWCSERSIKPLVIRRFFRYFKGIRKAFANGDVRYYIEKAPFYLSEEERLEFRRQKRIFEREEEKQWRRREKEKALKREQRHQKKLVKLKEKLLKKHVKKET